MRRLITRQAFRERLGGCGRTAFWKMEKNDPRFPRPVRVGEGLERFAEDEVDAFIEGLLAQRDAERAA